MLEAVLGNRTDVGRPTPRATNMRVSYKRKITFSNNNIVVLVLVVVVVVVL
jgi:hypothetical protein